MMLEFLLLTLGGAFAMVTLPGTLVLMLLSVAALLPTPRRVAPAEHEDTETGRIAVLVPAHNEAAVLPHTLPSLINAIRRDAAADLWVIADNCSDDTDAVARAAGANVMIRQSDTLRGKGYALEHAFAELLKQQYAWIVVIDADSTVDADFIRSMRSAMRPGREALQACYLSEPAQTPRGRIARLAQWGYNLVRPLGRARLGFSAGLLGNGFALKRALVERLPYCAHSVVEDLEYHIMLVRAGVKVHFVREAQVLGEIAETGGGARTQRTRWEGGRLRMIRELAWPLTREWLAGRREVTEALADLLLLPLGLHVLLLACAMAIGGGFGLIAGGLGGLAILTYVTAILVRGPTQPADILALAASPLYLAWKIALLPATIAQSRKKAGWQRSQRNKA